MEFVLVPIGDRKAKRLLIPREIENAGADALEAFVAAPPADLLEAADTVPYADPAPEPAAEEVPAAAPLVIGKLTRKVETDR